MNLRKTLALLLSTTLSLTLLAPLAAVPAAAEGDPWKEDAAWPKLTARSSLSPGKTYFTHKEWTGEVNSTDIYGSRTFIRSTAKPIRPTRFPIRMWSRPGLAR